MTAERTKTGSALDELKKISEKCINCNNCIKECAFLEKYGKPKEIADSLDISKAEDLSMAFECSLCELCAAVCPVNVNPAELFLAMRREAVNRGRDRLPEHARILAYERRGTSRRYSWYGLPEGCDAVFFPGCTLAGAKPGRTLEVYERLRKQTPSLGIVLDCCTLPSHDLGREGYFNAMFREMETWLLENGVREILVACPSCHKLFSRRGVAFSVVSVYERLLEMDLPSKKPTGRGVVVHDACSVRFEGRVQSAVRQLIVGRGIQVEELAHSREKTLCCGEGGSAGFVSPDLASSCGRIRKAEADGRRSITYCAGCEGLLRRVTPASHVLDLVFDPEAALAGAVKPSRTPFTYLNRLALKRRLRKTVNAAKERERDYNPGKAPGKRGASLVIPLIFLLLGCVLAIWCTGAARYLAGGLALGAAALLT
ncbi:MAG: (Fe-S)-binding protein, partial [Desulfobacterales bacterium]|nr:(Fe-S)-binding protein [Desulfobacterales bacterium]